MKRWFVAKRLYVYAPSKSAARDMAGRHLDLPVGAWQLLAAERAGRYEHRGNRIVLDDGGES